MHAGYVIGSAGDVNHDGFSDIAVSQLRNKGGTNVLYGGNPADSLSDKFMRGLFQSVVDLNGDGINEVVTSLLRVQQTGAQGVVYFFRGFPDSLSTEPYDSLIVPAVDGCGMDVPVTVGHGDEDSLGDLLVTYECRSGGPALYYYSGCPALDTVVDWRYEIVHASHYFTGFGFTDYNGDGHQDIYLGVHSHLDTSSYVYIYYGPQFGQSPNLVIPAPSNITGLNRKEFGQFAASIGDVNGDGWDDLGVVYDFQSLVYCGGPGADTNYDLYLTGRSHVMSAAGDVNGDGFNDIVTGQTRTFDGAVDLYLGGPLIDRQYECSIYSDDLPPALLQDIGYNVSQAGDFNGDGLADFMFSCRNFAGGLPGDVFVIAGGPGIVTGVDDDVTEQLPQSPTLKQNYPNPFNGGTWIQFHLDRAVAVSIAIFNSIGQRVAVLAEDQYFGAGDHELSWGGMTANGATAPSGVYFCRLLSKIGSVEMKMMLIK